MGGAPALIIDFEFAMGDAARATLRATCGVVLENGAVEDEQPEGATLPGVLEWITPDRRRIEGSTELVVNGSSPGIWSVAVSMPADSMVSVDLTIHA